MVRSGLTRSRSSSNRRIKNESVTLNSTAVSTTTVHEVAAAINNEANCSVVTHSDRKRERERERESVCVWLN